MKKIALFISLFVFAACSSSPKTEEAPATDAAVTETAPAPTTTETAPAESMVADTGGTMDGDFPDVEGTERSGATCKSGSDERMVSVIDTSAGPCGVVYTKHGNKKTVAYAKNDMSFCDKVYTNIIGNLTSGGFDCGGAAAAPAAEAEEAPAAEESKEEEAPAAE